MWQKRKKIKIFSIGNPDGQLETVDLSAGKVATRATGERRQNEKVKNFSAEKNPVVLSDSSGTAEDCEEEEDRGGKRKRKEILCVNPLLPYHFCTAETRLTKKWQLEILAG